MKMESRLLVVFFCTNPLKYIHITSCERFANYVDKTFSDWKEISIDLTVDYQINFSHLANPKALKNSSMYVANSACLLHNHCKMFMLSISFCQLSTLKHLLHSKLYFEVAYCIYFLQNKYSMLGS